MTTVLDFTVRVPHSNPPVYLVYAQGTIDRVCIGALKATTPSSYPGRSKAVYAAYHMRQDAWTAIRPIGEFNSRKEGAKALLIYMLTFKYWRGVFTRSGIAIDLDI